MSNSHQFDSLTRFIFEDHDIRGEIVRLNASYQQIIQQHQYAEPIAWLVGEALLAAVLLTASIKFEGNLTLQFQSDGPLKLLVAKCNHLFEIRGLAQLRDEKMAAQLNNEMLLGNGQLVVTIQPENQQESYQSVIALTSNGIANAIEIYFAQSEQLPTRIFLSADKNQCVGMLLQALPEQKSKEREFFWEHAVKLGETITDKELQELPNEMILHRLYHEEDIRIFPAENIRFRCTCNRNRMENAVQLLGEEDAMDLLKDKHFIEVKCEFCSEVFNFDKVDVAEIFKR